MLCNYVQATNAYLRNLISLELIWFLTFSLFVHLPNIFILDGKKDKSVWIFTEKWLIFGVKLGLSFVNWLLWSTMLKYKNIQTSLSFVLSGKYLFPRVNKRWLGERSLEKEIFRFLSRQIPLQPDRTSSFCSCRCGGLLEAINFSCT